jgi:RimJ/RimL family protein N-acetyltransferase
MFFTIVDLERAVPVGVAAYMRIMPASAAMEVGHLKFSPRLQRNRVATDAMYVMMKNAFALGYRRYEWKCDSFNMLSRAAAERFGFSYEGIFRNATVLKGRSRDTAWYSVTVEEWPELEGAFLQWLDPRNFDQQGAQRTRLSELTGKLRAR